MANSDKNIIITPNVGASSQPEISITGLGNTVTSIRPSDDSSATLDFVGAGTTLFSVSKETSTGQKSFSVVDRRGDVVAEVKNNGKVSLASKSGKLFVGGDGLKLPKINTSSTPPGKSGTIVYDSKEKNVKFSDGKTWISMYSPNHTLAEAVGVTPLLHYQSSDLDNIGDGTALNSSNVWINNGYLGRNYDMVNDTSGHYSSTITVTTQYGRKAANFSGFCSLAFLNAPYYVISPSGVRAQWTVAYVYGGGSNTSSNDSSPSFNGHGQGPVTNIPDRVQGGLFGWYSINSFAGELTHWWDNDGWTYAGAPKRNSEFAMENITPNQWINRLNMGRQDSWYGRTNYPMKLDSAMTGGSLTAGDGSYSGFTIPISGMGNVRRADSSAYTCTGYLYDAVLFDAPLSDEKIQKLRDYYALKYPFGNIVL